MTKSKRSKKKGTSRPSSSPEQRAAKRERRHERQAAQQAAVDSRVRRGRLRRRAIGGAGALALIAGGFFVFRPDPELAGVERPAFRGRGHVNGPTFDSPTPTSGPHLSGAPPCFDVRQPLEPGLAVHALEHGAVVVWYDAARSDQLASEVEAVTGEFESHVLASPNTSLDSPIVATAWNRLARYDEAGDDLREFIDTYRRRGPERQPCDR